MGLSDSWNMSEYDLRRFKIRTPHDAYKFIMVMKKALPELEAVLKREAGQNVAKDNVIRSLNKTINRSAEVVSEVHERGIVEEVKVANESNNDDKASILAKMKEAQSQEKVKNAMRKSNLSEANSRLYTEFLFDDLIVEPVYNDDDVLVGIGYGGVEYVAYGKMGRRFRVNRVLTQEEKVNPAVVDVLKHYEAMVPLKDDVITAECIPEAYELPESDMEEAGEVEILTKEELREVVLESLEKAKDAEETES